jgi:hypothetical protein
MERSRADVVTDHVREEIGVADPTLDEKNT